MKPVAVPLLVIAGVALYLGVYHLSVAIRAPRRSVDRTFGIHCLFVVTYAVAEAMLMNARSAEAALPWGYYADTIGLSIAATFTIFVQRYTRQGSTKVVRVMAALLALTIVVVILGPREWVIRNGFAYREMHALGMTFGFYESTPGIGVRVTQLVGCANATVALLYSVRFARKHDRRARPLLAAVAITLVAVAHDLAVEAEFFSGLYWLCYGFLAQAIVMAYALSDDVIRAVAAEAKLRESEERLALAIAGSSDGIFDWDLTSGDVHYAERFAEILGVPLERLREAGSDPFLLVPVRELESLRRAIADRIADGARLDVEIELDEPSGTRWLRLRAQAVRDSRGRARRFAGAISDVTERRLVDMRIREAQKLETVGRLAGGIAHDFNNMLAGVIAYADLIRHAPELSERSRMAADRLVEAGQRAAELTARLLAFSRRTSGVAAAVDVHRAIEQAISLLERTIDPRITIERSLDAARHVVLGDAAQMQSVVLNLGVNARDAMREGGTLRVATSNVTLTPDERVARSILSGASEYLVLSMSDTGTGIPRDVMEKIFEPFFTTKPTGEGTGLGLPAVSATVREMEGAITVESEVGRGTTVKLFLPLLEVETMPDEQRDIDVDTRFTGTVLVLDDQDLVRDAIRMSLEALGFSVVVAGDGVEGVERLREHRDDVVLVVMDLVMPKRSAEESYAALREAHPTVPILLISGFRGDAKIEELLSAGAAGFLAKPFRRHELVDAVKQALEGRTTPRGTPRPKTE